MSLIQSKIATAMSLGLSVEILGCTESIPNKFALLSVCTKIQAAVRGQLSAPSGRVFKMQIFVVQNFYDNVRKSRPNG